LLAAGYLGVRYNVLPNPFAREQTTEQRPSENAVPGGSIDVTVGAEPTVVVPSPTPIPGIENVLSEGELVDATSNLFALGRPLNDSDRGGAWETARLVNESAYFHLTGRTFEQDGLITRVVSDSEPVSGVYEGYVNDDGTLRVAGIIGSGELGTPEEGKRLIYAIGTPSVFANASRDLVMILANETGGAWIRNRMNANKARWWDVEPIENRLSNYNGSLFEEAAQYLYHSAVLHYLEEIGVKGLTVADTPENREQVVVGVERSVFLMISPDTGFTADGWYFAWWYANNDEVARKELENDGSLSSATALRLVYQMVDSVAGPDLGRQIETALAEKEADLKGARQRIGDYINRRLIPDGKITDVRPGTAPKLFVP
jgi:hypothetical protein